MNLPYQIARFKTQQCGTGIGIDSSANWNIIAQRHTQTLYRDLVNDRGGNQWRKDGLCNKCWYI